MNHARVKTILTDAKAKIEDVNAWCSGALALDRDRQPREPSSEYACAWCALGAVRAVASDRDGSDAEEALFRALPEDTDVDMNDPEPVADYNDNYASHYDVLALYDRAIEDVGHLAAQAAQNAARGVF